MADKVKLLRSDNPTLVSRIDTIAAVLGRYGLVIVIGWIGALKFMDFEAHQIAPSSPTARSWGGSTTSCPRTCSRICSG